MNEAIELLQGILDSPDVTEEEEAAFSDILEKVKLYGKISEKQQAWAESVAKRLDVMPTANLVSTGRVRGNEVETPKLLRRENLPMKPPGRP